MSARFSRRVARNVPAALASLGADMNGQTPWEALLQDFGDIVDFGRLVHVAIRLLVAAALGGALGYQRESVGKSAGMRTYMLVTVGAAFFVVVPQLEGMDLGGLSRVLQGIIAGIGFLGGGAILKLTSDKEVIGLTTAAGIWLAAAIGVAAGLGRIGTALLATLLAYGILGVVYRWEQRLRKK
jgi:putative Mg2+ transporter-C (MgtC) family protein